MGDLAGNAQSVAARTAQAAAAGAQVVAFPEMMLTGYPRRGPRAAPVVPGRVALAPSRSWPTQLADAGLGDTAVIVGYLDDDGGPRDASAFLLGGPVGGPLLQAPPAQLRSLRRAALLRSGRPRSTVVRHLGVDIALTVCEDVWQDGGPFTVAGPAGVGLVVNINASPYERNKDDVRLPLLQRRAGRGAAPRSPTSTPSAARTSWSSTATRWWSAPDGTTLMRAPQFVEGVFLVDIPVAVRRPAPADRGHRPGDDRRPDRRRRRPARPSRTPAPSVVAPRMPDEAEVWGALVTRPARLRPQERLPLGRARDVRRHRLGGGRRHRRRRDRRRERARRVDAERLLRPSTRAPTPPTSPSGCGAHYRRGADRADGRRVRRHRWSSPASPRRTCRPASGAPR